MYLFFHFLYPECLSYLSIHIVEAERENRGQEPGVTKVHLVFLEMPKQYEEAQQQRFMQFSSSFKFQMHYDIARKAWGKHTHLSWLTCTTSNCLLSFLCEISMLSMLASGQPIFQRCEMDFVVHYFCIARITQDWGQLTVFSDVEVQLL